MKKSFITIIISLLSFSLVGILLLQAMWINNAWQSKKEDFNRDVRDALNRVALRLETQETMSFFGQQYSLVSAPNIHVKPETGVHVPASDNPTIASLHRGVGELDYSSYDIHVDTSKHETQIILYADGRSMRNNTGDTNAVVNEQVSEKKSFGDSANAFMETKSQQLNYVLSEMMRQSSWMNMPIEKRLDPMLLFPMIKEELQKKGINLPFQYAVQTGDNDSMSSLHSSSFNSRMIPASYHVNLFPNDFILRPNQLLLSFSDVRPYFIRSLWWNVLLTIAFSMVIIGTFAAAIYVILKQKKVSEIKTDFINNMTHEFKTPIATISLAMDAISNPKVSGDTERMKFYTDIISTENKRMNAQVENILQMAMLDKESFELNPQLLDVHSLIERVADPVRLQVEKRNGVLQLNLNATNSFVVADEMHFTNVIYNLLDNANKYSPQNPMISVTTLNTNDGVVISVEDKGIGMSSDTQQRIFEKFFRASTGNVHDVKGFGLGLAYVKSIVKKHGGTIKVISALNEGSRVDVFVPFGKE